MKLTTLSTALIAALPAVSANSCKMEDRTFNTPKYTFPTATHYDIWAQNVYDIKGTCGGLWDNLKRFGVCATPTLTYCGGIESTHILNMRFQVTIGCNAGMIESTWWEATRNRFGSIHCKY